MALTKEAVAGGLGGLGKSPITLKHAYLTLQVAGSGVSDISVLRQYPHLQVLNLADNEISDASPLAALPHLHTLNLRNNKLTSVLPFEPDALVDNFADAEFQVSVGSALDEADLSGNQIEIMNDISQHRFLTRLFLNNNAISRIAGVANLSNLRELRLANNNISRIEGLADLPLRALDLSHNALTELGGLSTLSKLQVLNVSHNKIESMRGVESCVSLNILDMSFNVVPYVNETKHVAHLELLESLDLTGCPVQDSDHFRLRVLYILPRLRSLNGALASSEEKVKACNLHGADAQAREETFNEVISEVEFVNYMPPFEDTDPVLEPPEGKGDDDEPASKATLNQVANEYVDELLDAA